MRRRSEDAFLRTFLRPHFYSSLFIIDIGLRELYFYQIERLNKIDILEKSDIQKKNKKKWYLESKFPAENYGNQRTIQFFMKCFPIPKLPLFTSSKIRSIGLSFKFAIFCFIWQINFNWKHDQKFDTFDPLKV